MLSLLLLLLLLVTCCESSEMDIIIWWAERPRGGPRIGGRDWHCARAHVFAGEHEPALIIFAIVRGQV